jgi:DNA-binding CsgD family transcriptional regulator
VSTDLVSVIEAAYETEQDDGEWLRRIVELASRELDQGLGGYGCLYDVASGAFRMGANVSLRMSESMARAVGRTHALATPEVAARMYLTGPTCSAGSTLYGRGVAAWKAEPGIATAIATTPAMDGIGVVTGDPSGVGCMLAFPKHDIGPVPRATSLLWSRIAAHIAAGFRLRSARPRSTSVEAVLSPSGRVEHAETTAQDTNARAALTEGAKRMALARGALRRRDPSESVETWRALVAGRWSLVDHFDHDGRRFLLARRNEPTPAATLTGLTDRQRDVLAHAAMGHTNKLIAYELGLTPSAVAIILSRAARTLGVRTRVQLIAAYQRALGEPWNP